MKDPNRSPLSRFLVLLGLLAVLGLARTQAASYSFNVPGGGQQFFAGYLYQTQTISQVFPIGSVPYGTQVFVWKNATQDYYGLTFDDIDHAWLPNTNYVLNAGDVFFIRNNSANTITVTIYGTPCTSSIGATVATGKYNGYAMISGEENIDCTTACGYNSGNSYPGVNGDMIYTWDPGSQTFVTQTRVPTAIPGVSTWGGYCDPGQIPRGWGAFFTTGTTKSWTIPYLPVACGP